MTGSRALELLGDVLATVVEEQAEVDGDVEVDAEDVGLEGGAKADGGLEVEEAADESTALAWLLGELADADGDEAVEHVGAGGQFQGVDGAFTVGRLRGGRGAGGAAGTGECEEEEVEGKKEAKGS